VPKIPTKPTNPTLKYGDLLSAPRARTVSCHSMLMTSGMMLLVSKMTSRAWPDGEELRNSTPHRRMLAAMVCHALSRYSLIFSRKALLKEGAAVRLSQIARGDPLGAPVTLLRHTKSVLKSRDKAFYPRGRGVPVPPQWRLAFG